MDHYALASTRLQAFKGDLEPLSECAVRYLRFGVEVEGDTLSIAPTQWIAPMARAFWIYEGLHREWIPSGFEIPPFYRAILAQMNGCFAFDLSLYGLPTHDGLVNRTILRPLSIHSANQHWRHEYAGMGAQFHFGGAVLDDSENLGYFYIGGRVASVRKNGDILNTWPSVAELLRDELSRLEKLARIDPGAVVEWGRHDV